MQGGVSRVNYSNRRGVIMTKRWYQYLWIASVVYILFGFFNILFAWLGLLCFIIPLVISIVGGNKNYCNKYCGRGQLLSVLGNQCGLSRKADIPAFLRSKPFRYGFLAFFLAMFISMLVTTVFVFSGVNSLKEAVTLLWTVKIPWHWANNIPNVPPGFVQFAYGFYSLMLTSTLLAVVTMLLYKPRSWCVYCPMGTMAQLICKAKNRE
jgi:hypothetical protein